MEIRRPGGRIPSQPEPEPAKERRAVEGTVQKKPERGEIKFTPEQRSNPPAGSGSVRGETTITGQMMKLHLGNLVEAPEVQPTPPKKTWSPPEIYALRDPEGKFYFVDAAGRTVPTPPGIQINPTGDNLYYPATDPWGNPIYSFYPPPGDAPAEWPPGSGKTFQPPELYALPDPEGGFRFVNRHGNPLPEPPGIQINPTGDNLYYPATDPWGNPIYSLYPPPGDAPAEWPPGSGNEFWLPELSALPDPEAEGGFRFLDEFGNPVPTPPGTTINPAADPNCPATDPWGNPIYSIYPPPGEAPSEWPPGSNRSFRRPSLRILQDPEGGYHFVDNSGRPVPKPPGATINPAADPNCPGTDPWGDPIYSFYPPPGDVKEAIIYPDYEWDFRLYEWPPEQIFLMPTLYALPDPEGGFRFVDSDGRAVPEPPGIQLNPTGEEIPFPATDPWGNPIYSLYPPPGDAPAEWPPGSGKTFQPPGLYALPDPEGGFRFVDGDGLTVPTPPGIQFNPTGEELPYPATDPWGNPIYSFYPPPGEAPEFWPP